MTQPPSGPAVSGTGGPDEGWASVQGPEGQVDAASGAGPGAGSGRGRSGRSRRGSRRLPGGRVVLVATLVVITVALFEVVERERIGAWTGVALIVVSILAVIVTRPGDRSLPAMMPPLAFATAVAIAGQRLLNPSIDDARQRQVVMMVETLGENAGWVVAATAVAAVLALIGHLVTRRSRKRTAAAHRAGTLAAH